MAKQTKQKIFEEALNLLGEEGFAGLTMGTLAARAGLSKSGLFAHFKSKAELESQIIDQALLRGQISFVEAAKSQSKGLTRLNAFFEGWIGWTAKAGLKGGCPVAAGLFEYDDASTDNPTRMKLQATADDYHQLLIQFCQDAINTGELKKDMDKEQFVFEMYGIYLSHHTSLRFYQDSLADAKAKTAFTRLVDYNRKTI